MPGSKKGNASRRGASPQFTSSTASGSPSPRGATADAVLTSSTATAVPLPLIGEGLSAVEVGRDLQYRARHFQNRGERSVSALPLREGVLPFTSAGGAKPIAGRGGLEGFTPPHRFKARTAASDGQHAFTRAARSAGLNFAVRSLSKAPDRESPKVRRLCWHLIHR